MKCECGCGEEVSGGWNHRLNQPIAYRKGHHRRGATHDTATRQRISEAVLAADLSGERHYAWRGGRVVTTNGYLKVWTGVARGYVYEHRYVMAQHLGRELTDQEVVHHIDGERTNNDISNLMLFSSHSEHKRYESGATGETV